MTIDDELTPFQRRYAKTAIEFTRHPILAGWFVPAMFAFSAANFLYAAYGRLEGDPSSALRDGIWAGLMIGGALGMLSGNPAFRALGVAYARLTASEGAGQEEPAASPGTTLRATARRANPDPGALRAACLVGFASGLAACAVALWRFGGGEPPAWAGIGMAAAGGLGAGAALVASFLPRWMQRVAQLEQENERLRQA